ncbi:hypothetical protein llap_4408 [Limosa lapponica baueri]|uniref:Uncharacterized protein n=1 Tax=Limosa lapponica baueri TaxID=1758121 RepID=A0A2I0UGT9_LIMLA|nr:hypothetical protein llap_4408 [Limosa lapponica baueri]
MLEQRKSVRSPPLEEKGVGEASCDKLITTPIPCPPVPLQEEEESLTQPVPVFPTLRPDGPKADKGIVKPRRGTSCSSPGCAAASALKTDGCNVALNSEPMEPMEMERQSFRQETLQDKESVKLLALLPSPKDFLPSGDVE